MPRVRIFGSFRHEEHTVAAALRRFYAGPNGDRAPEGHHWHGLTSGACSVAWSNQAPATPQARQQTSSSPWPVAESVEGSELSEESSGGPPGGAEATAGAEALPAEPRAEQRPGWLCLRTATHERTLSLLAPHVLENFEAHPEDAEVSPDSMRVSYTRIVAVIAVIQVDCGAGRGSRAAVVGGRE